MRNENCQGLGSKNSAKISAVTAIYCVSICLSDSSPTLTASMCLSKDPAASRSKHKCSWTSPVIVEAMVHHANIVGAKIHKCEGLMNVRPPPIPGCSPPLKNAWHFQTKLHWLARCAVRHAPQRGPLGKSQPRHHRHLL